MANAAPSRLKIAYLSDFSPLDRGSYSGGNTRIYNALRDHVGDVTVLDPDWGIAEPLRRAVLAAPDAMSVRARWRLHLALAPIIARNVRAQLMAQKFDVLFGAYSFHSMAQLRLPYPMVTTYTSDATPTIYKQSEIGQSFGSWFAPSRLIDPIIERAEARVFGGLDLMLWPSDWLNHAARDRFGLDPKKSLTLPWGANIADPGPGSASTLQAAGPVEILLVGRDWNAKGGWITAATVETLRSKGVDARLTVIGCTPPPEINPAYLTVHPHLDKSKPEELAVFERAFRRAHFLMMPSMESYGFAFCEASAYGLPSLCLRAGGIPVFDGENGYALPMGATPEDFAEIIAAHMAAPDRHRALQRSSRALYERQLNWAAWGKGVADTLAAVMANT